MKKKKLLMLIGSICLSLVLAALLLPACAPAAPEEVAEEIAELEAELKAEKAKTAAEKAKVSDLEDEVAALKKPAEVFEWKVQSAFGVGSWDYLCGERALQRIEEQSGGQVKISYLAPGTIVAAFEQADACNDGVLDGYIAWTGYWVGKDTAFTLFASAAGGPFGMDTWDHTGWMFFGGGYELYRELYQELGYTNIVPFIVKGEFPEPLGWYPEPLETFEDLAGLKMRVAGLAAEVFKEAGVSVLTVPGGEILPLLEKGLLDASEYSDPHSDMRLGIADVLKYYHAPGIHQPTGYVELGINRARWEALPEDLQKLVESVCGEMLLRSTIEEYTLGEWALNELITEYDVILVESPDEILLKLLQAWDKVAAGEVAKNPRFAKIYESQREWAEKIVPYRGTFFKDYSFTAEYYWE